MADDDVTEVDSSVEVLDDGTTITRRWYSDGSTSELVEVPPEDV